MRLGSCGSVVNGGEGTDQVGREKDLEGIAHEDVDGVGNSELGHVDDAVDVGMEGLGDNGKV